MRYKLAIFDLDGTVLNTLDDIANSLNHTLRECGFPTRSLTDIRSYTGNGLKRLVKLALPRDVSSDTFESVFERFNGYYGKHCADLSRPYDGVTDMLNTIRAKGMKTAVISNKLDYAVQILYHRHFEGLFDLAVGEREGVRKKPAPDSVNEALLRLDTAASDAIYVGDSEVDLSTAKNAGLKFVAVDWGFRDRDFLIGLGADPIVSSPDELTDILLK